LPITDVTTMADSHVAAAAGRPVQQNYLLTYLQNWNVRMSVKSPNILDYKIDY